MSRRHGVELALLIPRQQRAQSIDQWDTRNMLSACHTIEPWSEPGFHGSAEIRVRHCWPRAASVAFGAVRTVELPRKFDTRLQVARVASPREHLHAQLANAR